MIIHEFDLDMIPDNAITTVKVNQYDDDFNLKINLFSRKGGLTIQAGTEVIIRGKKPDGHVFSADCSINGNVVTVVGNQQMTAAAGRAIFELSLRKNGKELNSANFIMKVERAPMDKDTPPSNSVIRELVDALDHTDEILEAAESVEEWLSTIDDTLSQPNKAADAKKTGDEIADLKSAVKNSDEGYNTFAIYGNFQHYGLDSNGEFLLNQQYRVSNDNRMSFDRDLTVSIANGFRVGICVFSDVSATTTTWGGWNTEDFTIPAGTIFNLQIARVLPENLSEIANVQEFVHAITFKTYIFEQLDSIKNEVDSFNGVSSEVKTALLACFRNVAWIGDDGKRYYDDLYNALYMTPNTVSVGRLLANCELSNTSHVAYRGSRYTTNIIADSGYVLGNVTVKMGGRDVTSTVYSNGTVTISNVTGKIEIDAFALPTGYTNYDYICNTVASTEEIISSNLIALPITGDKNTYKYDLMFLMDNATTEGALFGGKDDIDAPGGIDSLGIYAKQGGSMIAFHGHGKDEGWFTFSGAATSGVHHLIFDPRNDPTKLILDGAEQNREWANTSQALNGRITLFTNAIDDSPVFRGWGMATVQKLGRFRIYSSDDLLAGDYIPCKNSSNVAGVYDLVTSTFITASVATRYDCGNWA